MKRNEIHNAIDATLSELINVVSGFHDKDFNISPFSDSWTPGEVTQHLVLSIGGFIELLKGPTIDTNRKPDQHIELIRNIFLNFERKLKSPDFIVPERKDYKKEELLYKLKGFKASLDEVIETADLDKTCTKFEIPGGLGHLTRQEALAFVVYHTQRHIHQLRARSGERESTILNHES